MIALVYLARGTGAGLRTVQRFVESYESFRPGCPHRFFVIMKGWSEDLASEKCEALELLARLNAEIVDLPDDGLDWGAYIRFVKKIRSEYYCFLNTYSRPLVKSWLLYLYSNIKKQNVGICGSSGSHTGWKFMFPLTNFRDKDCILTPLRILRRLIWHFRQASYYPSKFAPHIRSNGFIVNGEDFRDFCKSCEFPKNKLDVYRLESGIKSYSNYILSKGQRLKIIDSLGKSHDISEWPISNTYCCPNQPNLLIADNNTDYYDKINRLQKQRMENDTWQQVLTD
jgi:hypothetical protein